MQLDHNGLISSRSMLTGGVITIYVGPKRKEYQIHKDLLTSCEYWRRYLDLELDEDSEMYLRLERPEVWILFVNWLYRGSLKDICMEDKDVAKAQVKQYVWLYIKAEQWAIPALQNKIMDRLTAWTIDIWDCFTCENIDLIYKNISGGSPLRSYVVDSFLTQSSLWDADSEKGGRAARLKSQLDSGNKQFALECFEALMQLISRSELLAPGRKIGCTYHKHEDGEKCSK